jgi:hypothetical protein
MIKLNKNDFKNVINLGGYEKITRLEVKNENWKKRNN